ncbi:MAG TPA: M17 family peptidase N-terminal domain-containing protein, partial [Solirubrobacterales bacterium]|nr:M17 family peptidase N-terminal domain-containing protein [Solirubrobacterales bacterium]
MDLVVTQGGIAELDADVVALALADGDALPAELADAPGSAAVKTAFKKTTLLRPAAPQRVVVVGLGAPDEIDAERVRVAGAVVAKQAASLDASSIGWVVPDAGGVRAADAAAALVEGTTLAAYRFDHYRSADPDDPPPAKLERLTLLGHADVEEEARASLVAAAAANRARDLQNLPSNALTPERLAARAEEIAAAHDTVTVDVLDREMIRAAGLGGLVAVSQGSETEPRLIAMRYEGGGSGPRLGLVGKAVTFDSGGISIKPSQGMEEMKFDMSGGAAVIEAIG